MLSRAARRRHALRYLQRTSEQLQLPWLCPALLRNQNHISHPRSITTRPTAPSNAHHLPQSQPSRQLASAAAPNEGYNHDDDDYLPFHSSSGHAQSAPRQRTESLASRTKLASHLQPIDVEKVLMLDSTVSSSPERLWTNRVKDVVIRGDANEIESTLEACLQVRKFDRAKALLRQLGLIYKPGSPNLLSAYNDCLDSMVLDAIQNRDQKDMDNITRMVEVDMTQARLEPNAMTYALLIKWAITTLDGSRRDRTVRKYWNLARDLDLDAEVAGLRDILTDRDLGKLSEICPMNLGFELVTPENLSDLDSHFEEHLSDVKHNNLQIRETDQKGLGLSSLRNSLSLFSKDSDREDHTAFPGTGEELEENTARGRQSRLETDAINSAIQRWRTEHDKMSKMGIMGNLQYGKLGAMLWQWHQVLAAKIRQELEMVEEAEKKEGTKSPADKLRCEYGPFLRLMDVEHLAATTIITALQTMSKGGIKVAVTLVRLVVTIGKSVEAEVDAEDVRTGIAMRARQRKMGQKKDFGVDSTSTSDASTSNSSKFLPRRGIGRMSGRASSKRYHWSTPIHARIGAVLCELLFNSAKISVSKPAPAKDSKEVDSAQKDMPKEDHVETKLMTITQPVFHRSYIYKEGRKLGTVRVEDVIAEMLAVEPAGDVIAKQLPMVSTPKLWKGFYDGGFLESQTAFIRVKNSEISQRDYGEAAAARGDLDQIFAGVDVLGKTAWNINRDVFHVMLKAWNSGDAIANLPPSDPIFPVVEKPESTDYASRSLYYRKMKEIENQRSGLHSNRCFQNFQMEIAGAYLNEKFYLPHNIDFRGRAYPIPPYFNQMGADNCRGLLLFANGRPLGESGLRWLKIHLSNVYGYDKASLQDRENFPMTHLDDVYDSVQHPLDGRRWWLTAEDPWQCLATCFELKKALESSDPCSFVSHLPVHQDGSCNGLQHYAALGGDIDGARQVNLEPGDKPADVYTGVAELVKAEIKQEALAGLDLAEALNGKITRKVVKQTVMTNVYGVTFLGAIRQVRRQLDDLIPELREAMPHRSGAAATYVARKIFKALGAMFSGAHAIQYWLGDCANRISTSLSPMQLQKIVERDQQLNTGSSVPKSLTDRKPRKSKVYDEVAAFRSSVIWTTPLKLPVVQPYRTTRGQRVRTNLQDLTLVEPTVADAVNKRKQLQAFPPNFIHSLDATHMILSALRCDELGLDFSAVHDSFWTHAADVDTLNGVLREAFIRMHSEDIMGRLAAEFKTRYKDHLYLANVRKGSELATRLAEFRTSFRASLGKKSKSAEARQHQELLLEIQRQKLLHSDDPAEREEGANMVTPASLFEELHSEHDLNTRDSLGETAVHTVNEGTSSSETVEAALHSKDVAGDVDMPQTLIPLVEAEHKTTSTPNEVFSSVRITDTTVEEVPPTKEVTRIEKRPQKPSKKRGLGDIWVWLPLRFRQVPRRGDFDVTRLRDSKYFFS